MSMKSFLMEDGEGHVSHSKFWSNVGYAAMTGVFLYAGIMGITVDPTLLLVFGGTVIGNRTLKVALKNFKGNISDTKS